ncbi:A/G-specific adenine glycosylase [Hoeflea sp. WL0058]|uniref:Adenine DNA glycosylase n=1 Tax=Flavimaribacter sediminis TaxID=2865987 RepID=A0AAE2ZQE6_9HYPH|nr:A/G-specific adenine glycosylase [Flavimaribacter sediminis]MBW8640124.1 A/G-specific adenine glycosylase [Flavimaribacter sediminis]
MNHSTTAHAETLLNWYDKHHRSLPWRVSPQDRNRGERPDPYRIWLSEIMLQQTTVQAVKPYFADFLKRWPTISELAAASEEDVLKAWAGLGYYSRARNLKKCADTIMRDHGGRFPQTTEALKNLPGIGDYTAAAIAAIAFDSHAAVVDGNIERVISRLNAIDTPLPAAKTEIKAIVHDMTPEERPGDFAQALMDLGARLCTPKRPACALCPFNSDCEALASSDPELYPVKPAKKAKPVRRGAAFVAVDSAGAILLRRRPDSGLLAGMSEVPTTDWTARRDGATGPQAAPFSADWQAKGSIKHVFTHFELRLDVYRADVKANPPLESAWWSPPGEIDGEALPTVMKKAIAAAIS